MDSCELERFHTNLCWCTKSAINPLPVRCGAVIFDLDDTLIQSGDVDSDCFREAFTVAFGLRELDADWTRSAEVAPGPALGREVREAARQHGSQRPGAAIRP